MYENYLSSNEDLNTIDEALEYVWNAKMDFVFSDRSKIPKTNIISYDSKFIYIWEPVFGNKWGNYKLHKIPHKLRIKNEWQMGWWAGLVDKSINKFLPASFEPNNQFTQPIISGGLLKPFVELQKNKKLKLNPYVTKESYLATIIHEFGHVYWDSFKMWWPSDKKYNIGLLRLAKQLYQKNSGGEINFSIKLPVSSSLGEVYAFCTEYYASEIFWPDHKLNLDKFSIELITKLIEIEKGRDLDKEDSVIEPTKTPHDFSMVYGRILLSHYPHVWPQLLISPFILKNT